MHQDDKSTQINHATTVEPETGLKPKSNVECWKGKHDFAILVAGENVQRELGIFFCSNGRSLSAVLLLRDWSSQQQYPVPQLM